MRSVTLCFAAGIAPVKAFEVLSDFSAYEKYSDAVQKVEITSREGNRVESNWEVNFRDGLLCWSEVDVFNPEKLSIKFTQTKGDIETFFGEWQVFPIQDGAQIQFSASLDLGIPHLAELLEPIAEQALVENIESIVQGLFSSVNVASLHNSSALSFV